MEVFCIPERGFRHYRSLTVPENYDIRNKNLTLISGKISADDCRYRPLPEEFLEVIQRGFDEARRQGVRMPDIEQSIHDDPRYSIRFANEGVWEEDTGPNILVKDFVVSASAPGRRNEKYCEFFEIDGGSGR